MPKEDLIETEGTVIDVLPDSRYRVKLENGYDVTAYVAGRMKKFRIRILTGDKVSLEMTPYDLTKARITYRHRDERAVAQAPRRPPPRRRR